MAIAIFATQNTSLVNLRLFNFESIKLPLGLLLVFCGGFGAVFINFWQTFISFALPNIPTKPTTSVNNQTSKNQSFKQATAEKKDFSKPNDKSNSKSNNKKDNFDEDWEDEWE
jgi:hypothetical protein